MHTAASLLETQRRFLAALYDSDAGPLPSIAGNGLEPDARLRIYRHSCDEIQAGALRTAYPAVLALVGAAFFAQTAHGYRLKHPSRAGNLQSFGEQFADYLASLPALRRFPYLPDIARLEWLRQQAALAAEWNAWPPPTMLSAGAIRSVSQAAQHPSVRLLASSHAVLTIWRYALHPSTAHLELPPMGEQVMLWREGDQVAMALLDPASFACIATLARGCDLAAAYAAGRAQDPDFNFAVCTESLVERGLLAAHAASTAA